MTPELIWDEGTQRIHPRPQAPPRGATSAEEPVWRRAHPGYFVKRYDGPPEYHWVKTKGGSELMRVREVRVIHHYPAWMVKQVAKLGEATIIAGGDPVGHALEAIFDIVHVNLPAEDWGEVWWELA